ncbi:MAG: lamin tail domain-containing protein, partial [Rubripirellula sp.]
MFTNVYVNGELYGLYTAVEQVDSTFTHSRFGDDEDRNLYKGTASDDAVLSDPDEAGAFEDWIELYHPGTISVDLSGFYLTDDAEDPTQWQFPAGSTIEAGGYLIIWADNDADQGNDHAA